MLLHEKLCRAAATARLSKLSGLPDGHPEIQRQVDFHWREYSPSVSEICRLLKQDGVKVPKLAQTQAGGHV